MEGKQTNVPCTSNEHTKNKNPQGPITTFLPDDVTIPETGHETASPEDDTNKTAEDTAIVNFEVKHMTSTNMTNHEESMKNTDSPEEDTNKTAEDTAFVNSEVKHMTNCEKPTICTFSSDEDSSKTTTEDSAIVKSETLPTTTANMTTLHEASKISHRIMEFLKEKK